MKYCFETSFEVRDYECDIQGIVNNANYLHYLEHTRHLFLRHIGLSFAALHQQGIDPVVVRMNLQYKQPLRGDDIVVSRLAVKRDGLRYVFLQDLYREADQRLCLKAATELVCLVNGRLSTSEQLDEAFAPYFQSSDL